MEIKWIGSPNYGLPRGTKGRKGYKVIAIVDHIMAGSLIGTDSWFGTARSEASAHFGIGKNGEIHQYVELADVAWHAGKVRKPDWALLKDTNPNYYTIGIEHEGQSGDVFTEAQYQATLWLHKRLIKQYGIPVTADTIIGHYRIDSVNKANCPGTGFPWERLFGDLKMEDEDMKVNTIKDIVIRKEGEEYEGVLINGIAYGQIRPLFESQGQKVVWKDAEQEVVITPGALDKLRSIKQIMEGVV